MLITLSKNSWHYKYYTWVYGERPEHKSICPYFWGILFTVLITPLTLFVKGIGFLIELIGDSRAGDAMGDFFERPAVAKTANVIGTILMGLFILFMALIIGSGLYHLFTTHTIGDAFTIIGIIVGVLAAFFGIIVAGIYFFTSDTWDLITGMAYGIKNKVCPMLKFKD